MNLTTRDRVQALMASGGATVGTALNDLIDSLIVTYSASVEQYLERKVLSTTRTEQFDLDPYAHRIELSTWPITSITSVKNDYDRDFTDASLVDASDYYANLNRGTIEFTDWAPYYGPGVLQVIYEGGMAADTDAFIAAFPSIAMAVDMQISYVVRRRDRLGSTATAVQGSSVAYEGQVALLDEVQRILNPYRRFSY